MSKYLFHGSYTPEGFKGLMAEGGIKRREAAIRSLESVGGKLEAFYFAFGDNVQLIDTHCHLDHEYFKGDREQVVERARAAGVTRWVNPSLSFKNIPTVLALTEQYQGCYAGVGIYPRYCHDWQPTDIDRVRQAAQHEKVVAIGEIPFYADRPRNDCAGGIV